jgi:hypothetical protein
VLNESAPVEAAPDGIPQGLYEQRRRVELLRQQVYAQVDSGSSEALEEALLAAEVQLAEMERARQSQGSPPDQGLLYDSVQERGGPLQARMGRETTGVEASIFLRLSHVPTGIVHLLDPEEKPLVSVKITNPGRQISRLRVTSQVEEYSTTAVSTLELPPGDEKEIHHLPVFSIERLRQVHEITRASLRVHIQHLSGTTEMERNFPIWLLARTTAYLEVRDPRSGSMIDLTPYLGAWVTPNAPQVMELLRRAVDLNPEGHIAGYQVDPDGVETQVKAIYYAVKEEKVQYVNSVFCFGREGGEFIQRIRLPRESLKHRSANCIDGTVLMASVLEAASLNPAIVLVPGHAFLAWEVQEGSGNWDYLETTLIGSKDFEEARRVGRGLAQRYRASTPARGNRKMFRLLPVPALRVQGGILPME